MRLTTHANRGGALEAVVIASQGNVVRLEKIPTASKRIGGGKVIQVRGPVDFAGTVCASGRAIFFDAKACALKGSFPVGNRDHFPEHQRQFLDRQGTARAIAGLLIEATHAEVGAFFWCDWRYLLAEVPSIPWEDRRLVWLGPSCRLVPFAAVVALYERSGW